MFPGGASGWASDIYYINSVEKAKALLEKQLNTWEDGSALSQSKFESEDNIMKNMKKDRISEMKKEDIAEFINDKILQ